MLRGTSSSGKKVQLMLVKPKTGGILGIPLDFYATHFMGFIKDTYGAHFYYNTAKDRKSLKVDFSRDARQPHAEKGIEKFEKSKDLNRELDNGR